MLVSSDAIHQRKEITYLIIMFVYLFNMISFAAFLFASAATEPADRAETTLICSPTAGSQKATSFFLLHHTGYLC